MRLAYEIFWTKWKSGYQLDLPTRLERLHRVSHVSRLRKLVSLVIKQERMVFKDTFSYVKELKGNFGQGSPNGQGFWINHGA